MQNTWPMSFCRLLPFFSNLREITEAGLCLTYIDTLRENNQLHERAVEKASDVLVHCNP